MIETIALAVLSVAILAVVTRQFSEWREIKTVTVLPSGGAAITFVEPWHAILVVPAEFVTRFHPAAGGYYVIFPCGIEFYLTAKQAGSDSAMLIR